MNPFTFLAPPVAAALRGIHAALSTVLPAGSGWAWGLSIVFLTIGIRLLLFPLFVKQIKSQRRMQELQPQVKALQAKHKGDRETLNTEMMKLYKENGTNPISGCLPLVIQLPVFFALFRTMSEFRPQSDGSFKSKYGFPVELIEQGAKAKIFGAPLSSAFKSSHGLLTQLDGSATTVKIVSTLMIVAMGATTFFTQRQMMARNGGNADPQQAQVQKVLLYVLPFSFAIFGFSFPIGVLLYWLTTNVWSMAQQQYVIARMPPIVVNGKPVTTGGTVKTLEKPVTAPTEPSFLSKLLFPPRPPKKGAELPAPPAVAPAVSGDAPSVSTASAPRANGNRPAGRQVDRRSSGSRKNKSRKGGRR